MICSGQKKNWKESDIKTTSVIVPLIGDADSSLRKRGRDTDPNERLWRNRMSNKKKIIRIESKCVKENRKRNG
jgi:hypothetical protein